MDILQRDINININIIFFLFVLFFFLILSIIVIFKLRSNNKMSNKTFTGFSLKSLYSLLTVVALAIGLVFGILAINSQDILQIEAIRTVTAEIYTNNLLVDGNEAYIDFKITPSVEGQVWGEPGDTFDIYWAFKSEDGEEDYSFIEKNKSVQDRSGMQKYFQRGSYEVNVTVLYESRSYTFTKLAVF